MVLFALIPAPTIRSTSTDALLGVAAVAVLVALGVVAIFAARRYLRAAAPPPSGFTLGDLRELPEAGEITDVEYEAAKASIIAQVKRPAASPKKPPYTGRNPTP